MKLHFAKYFSLLELFVVIAVLLVLASFTVPLSKSIKKGAHDVICKNNMKQLGALCTLYSVDNDGYLPGIEQSDCPSPQAATYRYRGLYNNWNGHLIPYVDSSITDYHRNAGVHKDGFVYMGQGGFNPDKVEENGYRIVKGAYEDGGYQNFKIMICPEAGSIADPYTLREYDVVYPRVNGLGRETVLKNKLYNFTGHTPSSYIANAKLFNDISFNGGTHYLDKRRISEMVNISKKVTLLEGASPVMYGYADRYYFGGGRQSMMFLSLKGEHNSSMTDYRTLLSFYHNDEIGDMAWVSGPGDWDGSRLRMPQRFIKAFNNHFAPHIYWGGSSDSGHGETSGYQWVRLVSFDEKDILKRQDVIDFFDAHGVNVPNLPMVTVEDRDFAFGETNVVFGDGSVRTMHQKDLFIDNIELTSPD